MRRVRNPVDSLAGLYGQPESPVGVAGYDASTDNLAYTPPWQTTGALPQVQVPTDIIGKATMAHSQWGPWFNAAGAGEPGGIRMNTTGFGNMLNNQPAPVQGLQAAGSIVSPQASPQERLMRQAQMQNQSQRAANFYPNAKNFPYTPYPQAG